ncbi:ATP synthase alpha chain mitochondrial precursor [Ancistrocladus abbreviatus]
MELSPRVVQLTTLLESRITKIYMNFQVDEIGLVVSVGDGIARVYRLNKIHAREMVEFASSVKGIALNIENENVGIVVFDSEDELADPNIIYEELDDDAQIKMSLMLLSQQEQLSLL